ncbi:hypothetical protein GTW69_41480 [Streptomyces sp. SID7760]|nr:hypothetical protein [Streptomyces sp. SID7760]
MTAQRLVAAELADALYGQVRQAADLSPGVRGADWRIATVLSVAADGTITTTDNIVARRTSLYVTPVVGDTVVLTVSGSGNWLAVCRVAPASTAGTWQPLSFSGAWTAWGAPHYSPAYRINGDGTVSLSGLAKAPGSTMGTSTIATLPAAARPALKARFSTIVSPGVNGALDVNTDGTIQITDFTGTAIWATLDGATFRLT